MHQQIGGSPKDTASNIGTTVTALQKAGINIVGIAPAFESPHVRVVVADGDTENALRALADAGLAPRIHSAVVVQMVNTAGQLKKAMDELMVRGFEVESILVLPGDPPSVSFGIRRNEIPGWSDNSAEELGGEIAEAIDGEEGGVVG